MADRASTIQRARTLQEHTIDAVDSGVVEDAHFRYVTMEFSSEEDERRVVDMFRKGWEVAEGHSNNDAKRVCLRMPIDRWKQRYVEACAAIKSYTQEKDAKSATHKGKPLEQTEEQEPGLIDDFAKRLPDEEDDIIDES